MNITKLVATLDDGSEMVVFPVVPVVVDPAPELPKVVVPLNTPIELVVA